MDASKVAAHPTGKCIVAITLLVFVCLFSRSMSRFFDLDEHQFVAPALLSAQQGCLPYVDYPYFHLPNLIVLDRLVLPAFDHKLLAARTMSVGFGTATLMLLFLTGFRWLSALPPRKRWLWAGATTLIYANSRLFTYTQGWAWNHDSAVFFAVAGALSYLRGIERVRVRWLALAGFCVGMAIGIRLSFAFMVVPLAGCLLCAPSALTVRQRAFGLALGIVGTLLALTPAFYLYGCDADRLMFGNLGYPRLSTLHYSSVNATAMNWLGKCVHFLQTFGTDPGNIFLLIGFGYAACVGLCTARERNHALIFLFALFPALVLGAFAPTPTQYQYHYQMLPFMTLAILHTMARQQQQPTAARHWTRWAGWGLVIVVGSGFPRWYALGLYRLPHVESWTPMVVHRVGEWIAQEVPVGSRVYTIDPIFPLEGGVMVDPDNAVGRFIHIVGPFTTADERRRYGLTYGDTLDQRFADEPPQAIFYDVRTVNHIAPVIAFAQKNGYRQVELPEQGYGLWLRPTLGEGVRK